MSADTERVNVTADVAVFVLTQYVQSNHGKLRICSMFPSLLAVFGQSGVVPDGYGGDDVPQ
jgi:hypothetical protein